MSYSFALYYVKTDAPPESLRGQFGRVAVAAPGWLACGFGQGDFPDEVIDDPAAFASRALSERFGEALYLFADSSADQLVYDHARDGELLRKLVWISDGSECRWECVAGAPEPWEEALFAPRLAQQQLAGAEEEEQEAIRAAYGRRVIEEGARYPSCDATVADLIEAHFGLTRPSLRR